MVCTGGSNCASSLFFTAHIPSSRSNEIQKNRIIRPKAVSLWSRPIELAHVKHTPIHLQQRLARKSWLNITPKLLGQHIRNQFKPQTLNPFLLLKSHQFIFFLGITPPPKLTAFAGATMHSKMHRTAKTLPMDTNSWCW